jgi:gas vesicle protein
MKQQMNHVQQNASSPESNPSYRTGLGYLAIGGAIGATLALLFAPKPGRQLRGDIADVSRKGMDTAREKARVINEKTGEIAHAVKEKADAVYGFATRKTEEAADLTTDAAASAANAWADNQDAKLADREKGFRPPNAIG